MLKNVADISSRDDNIIKMCTNHTFEALWMPILVEDAEPLGRRLPVLRGDRLLACAALGGKFSGRQEEHLSKYSLGTCG